ncbi:MAG: VCBS repeat-containing protein, partial [Candidatus Electrothrix sp. AUS1_2]|nr:VCBS repeat-containing protein [Candidatus Electrothrix sp. AUS1_2]
MNPDNRLRIDTIRRHPLSFSSCFFFLLLTGLVFIAPDTARTENISAAAQDEQYSEQQVIIPPFDIRTKEPHDHLRTGLANILATRVTKSTGHTVVQHSDLVDNLTDLLHQQNNTAVQNALQKMPNTYLLAGTLTEQGEGYEINIRVFGHRPAAQISLTQSFNRLESALSVLDELSLDIAEKIFSIARPKKTEVAASKDGLEGFHTAHPERMFKERKDSDEQHIVQATELETKNSDFRIESSRQDTLPSSPVYAMVSGDLDNDGTEEFVFLEKANLAIYHRSPNSSFQRIAFQPLARHLGLHTVFLADLDRNGFQEIYIGASYGTHPASQILEWDGTTFHVLYQN